MTNIVNLTCHPSQVTPAESVCVLKDFTSIKWPHSPNSANLSQGWMFPLNSVGLVISANLHKLFYQMTDIALFI